MPQPQTWCVNRRTALALIPGAVAIATALAIVALQSVPTGLGPLGSAVAAEPPHTRPVAVTSATATRIAFAGDTGTGPGSPIHATVEAMAEQDRQRSYDAAVLLGDLVYPEGDAAEVTSRVTGVFAPITRGGAQLLPVLGNHDYESDEQSQIFTQLGRDKTWYTRDIGIARILVLATERVADRDQTAWLAATLAAPTKTSWTIVAMHKPTYSAGYHGSDEEIQQAWVPLFEKYQVPLVLAGHDHDYQRSRPLNGVTYIVSGAAGKSRLAGHADFTAVSTSTLHYTDVLLERDHLTVRAIDQNGLQFDTLRLALRPRV